MSKFQNAENGIVVSVADEKDERFASGWIALDADGNAVDAPEAEESEEGETVEEESEAEEPQVKRSPGRPKKSE